MEYTQYLKTPHWRQIKQRIYKTRGGMCEECGKRYNLDVHHTIYRGRGKEKLSDLLLLCRECHYRKHRSKSWRLVKPSDVFYFLSHLL